MRSLIAGRSASELARDSRFCDGDEGGHHGRARAYDAGIQRVGDLLPSIRPSVHPQCFAASSIPARPTEGPPSPLHAGGQRAEEGATGAGGVIKLDVQDKGRNIGDAADADAIAMQPGYMDHVPGDEGGPSREDEDMT